jgi:hypothetical protein
VYVVRACVRACVCARSARYFDQSGDEIVDPVAIARQYAAGFFVLDLVSCLPGFPLTANEIVARLTAHDELLDWNAATFEPFELAKIAKSSKLLRTARLVKAMRVVKIRKIMYVRVVARVGCG